MPDIDFEYVMILGAMLCAALFVVHEIREWLVSRGSEQTKREIAAYVAEGSITPEVASTLMAATPVKPVDAGKRLASHLAWGQIKKQDASKVVEARQRVDEETWSQIVGWVCEGMPVEDAIKLGLARSAPASGAGVAQGSPAVAAPAT